MRFRFVVNDSPNDSITEAGVDFVRITARACSDAAPVCPADLTTT